MLIKTKKSALSCLRQIYCFWVLIAAVTLPSITGFSQQKTDSIASLLKKKISIEKRISLLNEMAEQILNYYPDSALTYLDQSISLCISSKNNKELALAYQRKSVILNNTGKYERAIEVAKKALPTFILIQDTAGIINTYSSIGISYSYTLKYKTALDYFFKGLDLAEVYKDSRLLVLMLNDVAYIYNVQKEYDKALPLLLRTMTMRKDLPNELPIVMGYINLSTIYFNLGSNDKSLAYLDTAYRVAEKWKLNHIKQAVFQRRGVVYQKMGKHEKAITNLRVAIQMQDEMNNTRGSATSLYHLANVYLELNKLDSANHFYDKGLEIANAYHFLDIIKDIYKGKSETLNKQGKFEESMHFLSDHYLIKDSLTNNDVSRKLADIESKYEIEKKEQEILHHEKIISAQTKALIWLIGLLIVTIGLLIIAIIQYQQKNRASKILAKTNLELTKSQLILDIAKPKLATHTAEAIKYSNSGLDEAQKEKLLEDIIALMEEKKPYLNPDLTLAFVAEELDVYPRYVSQIINEKFEKNFHNFINEYRVKEARILLISKDYENYSIEGIAQTAGFNSKSSFHTFFKKITGITPSYFRESALKQQRNN